jgi:hypothetical protein
MDGKFAGALSLALAATFGCSAETGRYSGNGTAGDVGVGGSGTGGTLYGYRRKRRRGSTC